MLFIKCSQWKKQPGIYIYNFSHVPQPHYVICLMSEKINSFHWCMYVFFRLLWLFMVISCMMMIRPYNFCIWAQIMWTITKYWPSRPFSGNICRLQSVVMILAHGLGWLFQPSNLEAKKITQPFSVNIIVYKGFVRMCVFGCRLPLAAQIKVGSQSTR